MRAHAVYSEGNQCKILVTPIESTVEMALRLETAIVGVARVIKVTPSLNWCPTLTT